MVTFNQIFMPNSLNADFVMQTLGAVVQTYASILALGGAFYLFMLERNQMEFRAEKEKIESLIRYFNPYFARHIPDYFENTLQKGFDWLNAQVIQLEQQGTVQPEYFPKFPEYREIQRIFPRYKLLKNRQGKWSFRLFSPMIGVSAICLILSLTLMTIISQEGINGGYNLAFLSLMLISFIGFLYLLWALKDMMKITTNEILENEVKTKE